MITWIYVGDGMVIHFTDGAIQQTETPTISNRFCSSSVPSCRSSVPSLRSSVPSLDTDIPCPRCGDCCQTKMHGVILSCLDCFLSGGGLHRFLYGVSTLHFIVQARGGTCTRASSDPTKEVLFRALYLLENGFGDYHFYKNNCEDFAIYCKTGFLSSEGGSGQAASYWAGAISIASTALGYFVPIYKPLIGCATYSCDRLVSDIGYRSSREINQIVPCPKFVSCKKSLFWWKKVDKHNIFLFGF